MIRRFSRDDHGGALVEFGLLLPTLLVFLALSVEGARTFWAYQTTITGVRDASRYLSRVVSADICDQGGSISSWDAELTNIVRNTQSGVSIFPQAVSIDGVTSTLSCVDGTYRGNSAPIATVTAQLQIGYPFSGIFGLVGNGPETVTTVVTDSARIVGS